MLQVASISHLTESRLSRQCGILNISQPYRSPRPVTGIALLIFKYTTRNLSPVPQSELNLTVSSVWDTRALEMWLGAETSMHMFARSGGVNIFTPLFLEVKTVERYRCPRCIVLSVGCGLLSKAAVIVIMGV
jgi:hypothetical protein